MNGSIDKPSCPSEVVWLFSLMGKEVDHEKGFNVKRINLFVVIWYK
jgi:hypothetical protein